MAYGDNGAAVLSKLFGMGGGGADTLELNRRRGSRMTELEDQIGAEAGMDRISPMSAATILKKGLFLKQLAQDEANDPFTGDAAMDRVHRIETQNDEVSNYLDPRQAAMRDDQLKNEIAVKTAPARVQGQYAVEAAGSKAAAQSEALQAMLSAGGDRSMSLSGVGSIGAPPREQRPQQIPGAVMNKLTAARMAYEKAKNAGGISSLMRMFGNDPAKAAYDQLVGARRNAVGYIAPELVDVLEQAAPHFKPNMSTEEKIAILDQMLGDQQVAVDPNTLYRALAEY
jgi:hypothetical protein